MTTKTPPALRPKYKVNTELRFLLPAAAAVVPEAVAEANERALAAHDRLEVARREHKAALEEAGKAPLIDKAADRAAEAAGKPLPEDRLTPKAQAALWAAGRKLQAAEGAVYDLHRELAWEILAAREEWLPRQREAIDQAQEEAREAIETLSAALRRIAVESWVFQGLTDFPTQGSIINVSFGRASGRDEQRAEARRQKIETKVREHAKLGGNMSTWTPRDADHLIGALKLLVDEKAST